MEISEWFALAQHNHQGGRLTQAEQLYRRILQSDPQHADAQHYLGLLAHQTGHAEAAIALMRQAIALNPAVAVYHANLGVVLQAAGQVREALACFTQALQLNPDLEDALSNRGNILQDLGRIEEAIASYRQALRLNPGHGSAHYNLGNALRDQGRLDEAIASFRQALGLNPRHLDALNNLGVALKNLGQLDEAKACYDQAMRLQPDHYLPRFNLSLLWLLQGDLLRGWPGYEFRWERSGRARSHEERPCWDGSPLQGRTILMYAEQGLGDSIQFIRYAPLVQQRGGNVLLECPPVLGGLFKGIEGVDRLLAQGEPLPPFDVQTALLSLPGLLGTRLDTIPAQVPYLRADPQRLEYWRNELAPLGGFQVGIVWQGSLVHENDRQRSVPLTQFAPLARVQGVRLFSLQVGVGTEQLAQAGEPLGVTDLGGRFDQTSLEDAAAVLPNLDLVVTVDTALAHLAGALGVPVWMALPFAPDWRWLLDREDSPWYPTMRLFRQRRPGDWDEVFQRAAAELDHCIATRNGR